MALTGPEIVFCVSEKLGGRNELVDRVAKLFSSMDHVRFSGTDEGDMRSGDLVIAQNLVIDLEAMLAVISNREEANAKP